MRIHLNREVDPHLFECVGGSLDGQVRELLPNARHFVTYNARGAVDEMYVLSWWMKRDAEGRTIWEGVCLVLEDNF